MRRVSFGGGRRALGLLALVASALVALTVALLLMTVLLLGPIVGLIPRVVIAATLVVVSIQLLDRWSLQAIRRLLTRDLVYWKAVALDLLVVVLVATVTIVYNLVAGVAVGMAVAVLFLLLRMSKSVIRRSYRGDVVRSRRTRDPRLMELLSAEGRKIVTFELEGPIFFGTAEYLAGAGGDRPSARDVLRPALERDQGHVRRLWPGMRCSRTRTPRSSGRRTS